MQCNLHKLLVGGGTHVDLFSVQTLARPFMEIKFLEVHFSEKELLFHKK